MASDEALVISRQIGWTDLRDFFALINTVLALAGEGAILRKHDQWRLPRTVALCDDHFMSAIRSWPLFLGLLLYSFNAAAAESDKVAVLVSGGDLGSLEESMQSLEKQAILTYENLGYKVIVVGGVTKRGTPLSGTALNDVLGGLRGVRDLRLDFIGHGSLQGMPDAENKVTNIPLSRGRLESSKIDAKPKSGEKLMWFAANISTADVANKYFGHNAELLGFKAAVQPPIVHTSVVKSLEAFRAQNKDAVATVNLLNCFSGALAQELRTTPNTIVYANSPHTYPALNLDERTVPTDFTSPGSFIRSKTGLGFYYDQLSGSKSSDITLDSAREAANLKMLKELRESPSKWYMTGRSPKFESVIGWCESGEPGKLASRRTPPKQRDYDLQSQMDLITKSLEYVNRLPNEDDPSKKQIDVLKRLYLECRHPKPLSKTKVGKPIPEMSSGLPAQSLSGGADRKKVEKQTAVSSEQARAALLLMFDKYEQILRDPSKKSSIFENIKSTLEIDKRNLRQLNLPEVRWGSIKKVMDGVESGELSADYLISRLLDSVARMKKECSSGPIDEHPCRENFGSQQAMLQWLSGPGVSTSPKCARTDFQCLFTGELTYTAYSAVAAVWVPSKPQKPSSVEERCADQPWLEYLKVRKSIEQDRLCYSRFLNFAPDEEWKNLERLDQLGKRSARGEIDKSKIPVVPVGDERKSGVVQ